MAAVTFTKLANKNSKNVLAYKVTADGAANATVANATLLADCPAGKLRNILASALASDAACWTALFDNPKVNLSVRAPDGVTGAVAQWKFEFLSAANLLTIKGTAAGADATGVVLEIAYRHSLGR